MVIPEFDITGPLPMPGTTLLEASAGTGKTWTIAALVARYVVEGVIGLDKMLVVTFGRAASQELRERVRDRLVEVEHALAAPPQGKIKDPVLAMALDADEVERGVRLRRVRRALTEFDAASIVTIHQFCHTVLRGLGVAGDTDPSAQLVDDLDDLLTEVIDDIYLKAVTGPGGSEVAERFSRKDAGLVGFAAALRNRLARLEPTNAPPGSLASLRRGFADAVRTEFDHRKRRLGLLSYDDLLAQLANALADPTSPARQRMHDRWSLVLVDEFQDTDPTQWQVFERAFHHTPPGAVPTTLVLIGDPKQAIYAFRGGDVVTYLRAKQVAVQTATLTQNYRSDQAVLDAVNVLLSGAELGDPEILVHPVTAHHTGTRLVGAKAEPFRMRVLTRSMFEGQEADKPIKMEPVRRRIADDLADDVHRVLREHATFDGQRIEAGDIAVLAYKRDELRRIANALAARGIPSVMAESHTVFTTSAGTDWLTLLEALEQPHRSPRVRAAALTPFVGETLTSLAEGGEGLTESLAERMRDWIEIHRARGIAAVFEAALEEGLDARLLGQVNGERRLTDLRHVAEILHQEYMSGRTGIVALTSWLRDQLRDDRPEVNDQRTRRLDSDAHAVQLVTIHGSKGLEYPIVYLPFAFSHWVSDKGDQVIAYHDAAGQRVLDLTPPGARDEALDERARQEDLGERLRLLYVAMTRAKAQLVAWWAPTFNTPAGELHRLLFGRKLSDGPVPARVPLLSDEESLRWLRAWQGHEAFVVEQAVPAGTSGPVAAPEAPALAARQFTREIDFGWRRTSYSSLTSPAEQIMAVGSEPDIEILDDEPDLEADEALTLTDEQAVPDDAIVSPMADLPVGAQFGSLVHAVLEHADPAAPDHGGDLRAELRSVIEEQWLAWPQEVDRDVLAEALEMVCDTPLGPAADQVTLREIGRSDRLCELDFELPLSGGDTAQTRSGPRLADIAPLLVRHLPEGDPVRGWASALADPVLGDQSLRGYLTGSVDVVLRVNGRYLVVDYKTNWLGTSEQPLTSADYSPQALDAAMAHSAYPLQALLYAVVLHRFLRWRLPGYDPHTHFGGVLYLYLRGMCGPDTPVIEGNPCGVFTWRPPVALVVELSDLLDGGDS